MSEKNFVEKYQYGIAYANVIATLAVVILHVNGSFWDFDGSKSWAISNAIESLLYFAVPIFFMISGATLMDYRDRYDTKTFFKKRFQKTGIPFLFWSVVAIVCNYIIGVVYWVQMDFAFIFGGIFGTKFMHIYWFFLPLFGIYLSMPLFTAVEKKYRKPLFIYLAIVAFVLNHVWNFWDMLAEGDMAANSLVVSSMSGPLLYMVVGYLLTHYEVPKRGRILIYLVGVAGLFSEMLGTYYSSMSEGRIVTTFKGYYNVPAIVYAVCVFLLIMQWAGTFGPKHEKLTNGIKKIGTYCFPIYLIHYFVLHVMLSYFYVDHRSLFYRIGGVFISIAISVAVTFILRKIPYLRAVVPK